MDKIEKIRQEIERRLKDYWEICFHDVKAYNEDSNVRELKELLSFLDTFSKEPDKSLEEAAEEYRRESIKKSVIPQIDGPVSEYGGNIKSAFIAGAKWQKEQILKDTVGGMVCATITNQVAISFFSPLPKELKAGDKVRIVVIREEEE